MHKEMAAASEGPISPELVLVSPEIRARVLESMPDPAWVATVAQVRARTRIASRPLPRRRPRLRRLRRRDIGMAALNGVFVAAVALSTLTLTFIADASR